VDEIGNGTDPAEGGALAAAVLQALVRRRVTAIVTTHLTPLKDVAARTPGVENASLEFDAASLTPTYRFLQGVPGRSYGLAVAQRLGLPADVLAEAEAAMPEAQRALEALLADLEAKTQALEAREREAAARELAADRREQDQAAQAGALGERERALREKEGAAERTGRAEVPAIVVDANDAEALMLSLSENLGRRDFSPLDEARAYLRLLTEYRVSPSLLARRLARERSHIATVLRLLGLPERVRTYLDSGQLAPEQAYALLGAPDAEALAERMVRGGNPPTDKNTS